MDPGLSLDPQRTIQRLSRLLAEANLLLAQYAGLCDQLLEERQTRCVGEEEAVSRSAE